MSFEAMAWAVGHRLPVNQKIVLMMLANRANSDTGKCIPSHKRLADDCGLSPSSVKRAITELAELGLLDIESRRSGDVSLSNQYHLRCDRPGSPWTPLSPPRPPVGSSGTGVGSARPDGSGQGDLQTSNSFNQAFNQEGNPEGNHSPDGLFGGGLPATSGEDRPAKVAAASNGPKDPKALTFDFWHAYAAAYRNRYNADPVWNRTVAGMAAQVIARLGQGEAPAVAAFFVSINDRYYINRMHPLNLLLQNAEAVRTQWATGQQMTATKAGQADQTQGNLSAAEEAIAMLEQRESRRA